MTKHPRCIAIHPDTGRCRRRPALVRHGQLYMCGRHAAGVMIEAEFALSLRERRRLAYSRWRTLAQAQVVVDGMRKR